MGHLTPGKGRARSVRGFGEVHAVLFQDRDMTCRALKVSKCKKKSHETKFIRRCAREIKLADIFKNCREIATHLEYDFGPKNGALTFEQLCILYTFSLYELLMKCDKAKEETPFPNIQRRCTPEKYPARETLVLGFRELLLDIYRSFILLQCHQKIVMFRSWLAPLKCCTT